MSAMNDLHMTIQEMLLEGAAPKYIAKVLDIPVVFVYTVMEDMDEYAEDFPGNAVATPEQFFLNRLKITMSDAIYQADWVDEAVEVTQQQFPGIDAEALLDSPEVVEFLDA